MYSGFQFVFPTSQDVLVNHRGVNKPFVGIILFAYTSESAAVVEVHYLSFQIHVSFHGSAHGSASADTIFIYCFVHIVLTRLTQGPGERNIFSL